MTVLQGYKTIILDDGLYLLSFPLNKQMKFIHVLTLYMQDTYKGGLAAEPVLYNMLDLFQQKWRLRDLNPTLYPWKGYVINQLDQAARMSDTGLEPVTSDL